MAKKNMEDQLRKLVSPSKNSNNIEDKLRELKKEAPEPLKENQEVPIVVVIPENKPVPKQPAFVVKREEQADDLLIQWNQKFYMTDPKSGQPTLEAALINQNELIPVAWMPDGKHILCKDKRDYHGSKSLVLTDIFNEIETIFAKDRIHMSATAALSRDGSKVLVPSTKKDPPTNENIIYLIDMHSKEARPIVSTGSFWDLRFSPDGSKFLFQSMEITPTIDFGKNPEMVGKGPHSYLTVYDLNTNKQTRISGPIYHMDIYNWVSDNEVLLSEWPDVRKIDIRSPNTYKVIAKNNYFKSPKLSPDGKRVAYFGKETLEVMRPDGSERKVVGSLINPESRNNHFLDWAPDSTRIAYSFSISKIVKKTPKQTQYGLPESELHITDIYGNDKLLQKDASFALWRPTPR